MSDPSVFGLDNRWTCYAVEVVTGKMITELPLTDISAQVRLLTAGQFTATLPLGQYEQRSDAQALLDVTTPGKYSVVLDLDGQIVGEWIIWKRTRIVGSDGVALSGMEITSLLEHRIMWAYSWSQTEQLDIATFLAKDGFIGTPGTTALVRFPAYYPSGVKRDRSYVALDGTIGTRLRELSQVDNGFDFWLHTFWDPSSSLLVLAREFTLAYPRVGVDQPFTFELGRNLASAELDEDAVTLASRAFAIGATTNDVVMYGYRTSSTLTDLGYPLMDRSGSWTSVTDQFTIDSYAQALLNDSQSSFLPVNAVVYADLDPQFGQYGLGDRVALVSPPTNVFPMGVSRLVRIVGWDLKPDVSTPSTISLVVVAEG
jgi:hypothetical protein